MSNDNNSLVWLEKILSRFSDILKLLPYPHRIAGLGCLILFVSIPIVVPKLNNNDLYILIYALANVLAIPIIIYIGDKGNRKIKRVDKVRARMANISKDKGTIVKILQGAVKNTSKTLSIQENKLRANIFMPTNDIGGLLEIPEGLHYNMKNPIELTVKIQQGYGCTGNAFSNKEPTIAIFKKDWGKHRLDDVEMRKVDKNLAWIISMPIPLTGSSDEIIGVLNIDCLNIRKEQADIEVVVSDIWHWVNLLAPLCNK